MGRDAVGLWGGGGAVNWGNSIMPEDRQRQLCLVNVCPPVICEGSRRSVAKPDEGGTGTGSGIEVGEEKEGKQGLQLRLCGAWSIDGLEMRSRRKRGSGCEVAEGFRRRSRFRSWEWVWE